MKTTALDYLACPSCKHSLVVKQQSEVAEDEHILSGTLVCTHCSTEYPIRRGVPRLMPVNINNADEFTGKEYETYFNLIVPQGVVSSDTLYGKTIADEIEDFKAKTGLENIDFLKGKVLLDAGCGMGRIDGALAEVCKSVVAFDVTPVVEQTFTSWRDYPNIHVVQATITDIPVKQLSMDFVWCDGALPYVSNVEQAIKELAAVRNEDGMLYSWCYGPVRTLGQRLGRFFYATRLPLKLRMVFIKLLAYLVMLAASVIRFKNKMSGAPGFAEGVLDLSLSPQVNHISEEDVSNWLQQAGGDQGIVHVQAKSGRRVVEFYVNPPENQTL